MSGHRHAGRLHEGGLGCVRKNQIPSWTKSFPRAGRFPRSMETILRGTSPPSVKRRRRPSLSECRILSIVFPCWILRKMPPIPCPRKAPASSSPASRSPESHLLGGRAAPPRRRGDGRNTLRPATGKRPAAIQHSAFSIARATRGPWRAPGDHSAFSTQHSAFGIAAVPTRSSCVRLRRSARADLRALRHRFQTLGGAKRPKEAERQAARRAYRPKA